MSARSKAILDRVSVATFVVASTLMWIRIAPTIISDAHWLVTLLAILGGYLLADFLAGSVHWMADQFFDPETPFIGPMLISPFREHHEDALGITRHDLFEVSGNNALVTLPLVMFIATSPGSSGWASHFLMTLGASLTLALFVTNLFHRWAHSPSPPRFARLLHSTGLILTPARHNRHHGGGHDRAYCVTSGWLNPLLDRIGFFERLERIFHTGPRRGRRTT